MGGLEIAFGIVLLIFSVSIIVIVLSQQGEQRNSSVITGGTSDTYISRNSGRTIDAFLARWTKFFAVGFFLCVIAVNIVLFFVNTNSNSADAAEAENTTSVVSTVEESAADSQAESAAAGSAVESAAESAADSSAA